MSRDSYRKYRFERQGIRENFPYCELVDQQSKGVMGANLFDFLNPVSEKPAFIKEDVEEATKFQQMTTNLKTFKSYTISYSEREAINSMFERFNKCFEQKQIAILEKSFQLPDKLVDMSTTTGLLATTPVINTKDIKKIANLFGFVIIPFEYMNEKAYKKEDYSICKSILHFNNACSSYFSVYVICPISYYDIQKHISAEEDKSIFAPKDADQAFMAINMVIPSLRLMSSEITTLKNRTDSLSKEVNNLSRRVDDLASQVERIKQENIIRAAETAKAIKAAEELSRRLERQETFIYYDPLMFAIPRKTNLLAQDSLAFVGPCWGPDIADVIFSALNLKKNEEQRNNFRNLALRWRSY